MLNLLISCSRGLYLFKDGHIDKRYDSGVLFGIAMHPDYGCIVLNRNNQDGSGGGHVAGVNSLEFFDKNYTRVGGGQMDFIKDGHQILCKDDILYLCNSGLNLITTIQKSGEVGHIQLYNEVGLDKHHINSVNFHDNKWYVCQHRFQDKDDGGVAVFNNNWKFIEYILIGKHCHNALIKDGFLWSCDSDNGQLIKINLESREKTAYSISHNLMTRGIVINGNFLAVGLSEYDTREMRHKSKTARVNFYSYPDMVYLSQIEISDAGQCNDIIAI